MMGKTGNKRRGEHPLTRLNGSGIQHLIKSETTSVKDQRENPHRWESDSPIGGVPDCSKSWIHLKHFDTPVFHTKIRRYPPDGIKICTQRIGKDISDLLEGIYQFPAVIQD